MLEMSEVEVREIDEELDIKMQWAKENTVLAEQLAMDATRLMSCTSERLKDYKDKGFFKRCVASFSGKISKMQRDNQNDIVAMQKMGWRYLQILNERDILMAHSLITIKNNLETLVVQEDETRKEITRFATKVKEKFDSHSDRLDELEVAIDIQQWLSTIEVQDYVEQYPKYMRLLCLVRDFKSKKAEDWNMKNIQCLMQAIVNAKINRKEKITLEQFVHNIIDEIAETDFDVFGEITILENNVNQKIDTSFLIEEISSPIFNCLYQVSDKYTHSDDCAEAIKDDLNISKEDAIKKIILRFIKEYGVDITKEIQLQDIALEILSCSKLAQELFNKNHKSKSKNKQSKDLSILDGVEEINNRKNKIEQSIKKNKVTNLLPDLKLSVMSKKFAVGDDFGILINNDGVLKAFGGNFAGCLGIGSNEWVRHDKPISVIDLPKDIKCVAVDVGYKHSLVLLENGDIYAWGHSKYGQLGDNTDEDRLSPFKVIGLPKDIMPVKIVAGIHSSFVLLENGDLYATGKSVDSLIFVHYKLDFKVEDFDLLYGRTDNALIFMSNNRIFIKKLTPSYSVLNWCKFDENIYCELIGMHEDAIIEKIVASNDSIHILTKNGNLYAIGDNRDGQLGINDRKSKKTFSKVYGIDGVTHLASSHEYHRGSETEKHFVVALTDSSLYGWGTNKNNQLGEHDNFYSESYETGIIFKDKHYRTHYVEKKPKEIKELSSLLTVGNKFEIACGNETTYLYDYTDSKLYFFEKNKRVAWMHEGSWIVSGESQFVTGESCYTMHALSSSIAGFKNKIKLTETDDKSKPL